MSLTVLADLDQGSEEWHKQRRGMVTASVVGRLISAGSPDALSVTCDTCKAEPEKPCLSTARKTPTPIKTVHDARTGAASSLPPVYKPARGDDARGLTALLVAERLSGNTDPTYISNDMWRGIEDEPRAVDKYADHYGVSVDRTGFMIRDDWGFSIGYSPDGVVGDDGLLEVKSRRQKAHLLTILADEVPEQNMAQLQCGLLVSGRKWIDYLSYCGGMPMYRKRVEPDPRWFEAILAAVEAFEETAAEMTATYTARIDGLPMTERIDLEMTL